VNKENIQKRYFLNSYYSHAIFGGEVEKRPRYLKIIQNKDFRLWASEKNIQLDTVYYQTLSVMKNIQSLSIVFKPGSIHI